MPRNSSVNRGLANTTIPIELPKLSTVRCEIYTRKSTEEGLQQEFNSLDAQREAAEAFIRSQKHEGWEPLPDLYDDGGYTGGNMDRPALQRLIDDINRRAIDCVVVYKVDRLSRSLLDFAKLMELTTTPIGW
jgi:site-specific DNA recombinase